MDLRRVIIFVVLAVGILLLWEKYLAPEGQRGQSTVASTTATTTTMNAPVSNNQISENGNFGFKLAADKTVTVTTDVLKADINTIGGDIRKLQLLKYGNVDNPSEPFPLLEQTDNNLFVAQTGLVANANNGIIFPTHNTLYQAEQDNYVLAPDANTLTVKLKYVESSGIEIIKTLSFRRGSYIVDVGFQIINNSNQALNGLSAYWRLLRDDKPAVGDTRFVHTFAGPAYYTDDAKFSTIKTSKLADGDVSYPSSSNNGWVGFIQHYFMGMWLLDAYNYPTTCSNGVECRLNFKMLAGNLVSSGFLSDLPTIQAHSSYTIATPLFVGPQEYHAVLAAAPHLELTRDYGWVYIFATPLFWLLIKLFGFVKNWGLAIIALTIVVKLILYPLTRAGYLSMAKMKALAPKMEALKQQYGDDKVQLQKSMMELYRSEKVNPIGGCLPMIIQVPVFIGLYWALLSSVELRQASFLWIHDLSRPDPYYILPVILAVTMFLQTFLNPPPSDPMQAKMMKIMPVAFSVMFFFFPAGLVLYWFINNVISIAQQWYVNKHVVLRKQNRTNSNAHHYKKLNGKK